MTDRGRQRGEKEGKSGRKKENPSTAPNLKSEETNTCEFEMEMEKEMNISGEGNEPDIQECKWGQMCTAEMQHI